MRHFSLLAIVALSLLLTAGCGGGGSSTVIGTGLPAGTSSDSFFSAALVLSVQNAPSATFFDVPVKVADSALPASSAASGLTVVSGTGYHLFQPNPAFSAPVTVKIKYDPTKLPLDPTTKLPLESNLAIYYLTAGNVWVYAAPVAGGAVVDTSGNTVSTTISAISGTGVYAVLASVPPALPAARKSE